MTSSIHHLCGPNYVISIFGSCDPEELKSYSTRLANHNEDESFRATLQFLRSRGQSEAFNASLAQLEFKFVTPPSGASILPPNGLIFELILDSSNAT